MSSANKLKIKFGINDRNSYLYRVKSSGAVLTFADAVRAVWAAYPKYSLTGATMKLIDLINQGQVYELVPLFKE